MTCKLTELVIKGGRLRAVDGSRVGRCSLIDAPIIISDYLDHQDKSKDPNAIQSHAPEGANAFLRGKPHINHCTGGYKIVQHTRRTPVQYYKISE